MPTTITLTHHLDDAFLQGVLVTAIEGGINHWARIKRVHPKPDDYTTAEIEPLEGDDFDPRDVDLGTIAEGLQLLAADSGGDMSSSVLEAIAENDAGGIDADDADTIVQYGLFKELVYG